MEAGDDSSLLYGADPRGRIVAVEIVEREAVIYRRAGGQGVTVEREAFRPFFLTGDPSLIPPTPGRALTMVKLEGPGRLTHLVETDDWERLWGVVGAVVFAAGKRDGTRYASWREVPDLHVIATPEPQHLVRTGKTLFKNMEFDDLARMQIAVKAFPPPGNFRGPRFAHPEERVFLAAFSDGRGWSETIDLNGKSEAALLRDTVVMIRRRDPDVIEGRGIFEFILPCLAARCALYHIPFNIGRDGKPPEFPARRGPGRRSFAPENLRVHGRHVIGVDAVDEVDGVERELEQTEKKARALEAPLFFQARMAPYPYQRLATMGVSARLEGILLREYLRQGRSVPVPQELQPMSGGMTKTFVRGVRRNVLYVDAHSMYPSIMLAFDVCPVSDELRLFPRVLRALVAQRLAAKRAAKEAATPAERLAHSAVSESFKILINSAYGYLGFGAGLWNDPGEADRVARIGRDIMQQMIAFIEQAGGEPIEADTDGVYFIPPPDVQGPGAEEVFCQRLSDALPPGIETGLEGRYPAMLSYADKNYALLTAGGEVVLHGSALRSRALEPYLQRFLREAIGAMLRGQYKKAAAIHRGMKSEIERRVAPLDWFIRREHLNESLEAYEQKIAEGLRGRSAMYEVALRHSPSFGRGDEVAYYLAGRPGGAGRAAAADQARLAEEFSPARPDYSVTHYCRRLDETLAMLAPLFPESKAGLAKPDEQMSFF